MFATLVLAAALPAAPVPKDSKPAGPAPRVVEFVPDQDGKVRVLGVRQETRKHTVNVPVEKEVVIDGRTVKQLVVEAREQEVKFPVTVRMELGELPNLTIYTADGKEADKALALKKLADGGVVVISADGQKVDPKYLKLFRDDTLVLVAPELANGQSGAVQALAPVNALPVQGWAPQIIGPAPVLRPLPPPAPPVADGGVAPAPLPAAPPPPPPAGTQRAPGNPGKS